MDMDVEPVAACLADSLGQDPGSLGAASRKPRALFSPVEVGCAGPLLLLLAALGALGMGCLVWAYASPVTVPGGRRDIDALEVIKTTLVSTPHSDEAFIGPSYFSTTFERGVSFQGATFKEDADFSLAVHGSRKFPGGASFTGATFEKGSSFILSEFHGGAHFCDVKFANVPLLLKATMTEDIDVTRMSVENTPDLSGICFLDEDWPESNRARRHPPDQ
jgi:Pentapeptide repeats (9 copies)